MSVFRISCWKPLCPHIIFKKVCALNDFKQDLKESPPSNYFKRDLSALILLQKRSTSTLVFSHYFQIDLQQQDFLPTFFAPCVYIHVLIHTCKCVYEHIYIYICLHTRTYTHAHTYARTRTHTRTQ